MSRSLALVALFGISPLIASAQGPPSPATPAGVESIQESIAGNENHLHSVPVHHEEDEEEIEERPEHPYRFWARAEYLLWWIKDINLPPLVTTGAATDPRPGALGFPATRVLFGTHDLEPEERSGGRFTFGLWLSHEPEVGIEAGYFFLGQRSLHFFDRQSGAPILARPFLNAITGLEDSSLVTFPGLVSGSVDAVTKSYLDGAELNLILRLGRTCHFSCEGLIGFRYLNLAEDVRVLEDVQVSATAPRLAGSRIRVLDSFETSNYFYGGQFGLRAEARYERWDLSVLGKIAFGDSHEVLRINGATNIDATTFSGGLLAVSSNIGRYDRDRFAVVPEVGVTLGFRISRSLRTFVGYSFLYCNEVLRPGSQIDRTVNPNLVPTSATFGVAGGPARPAVSLNGTDFWAQGLHVGLEFRY